MLLDVDSGLRVSIRSRRGQGDECGTSDAAGSLVGRRRLLTDGHPTRHHHPEDCECANPFHSRQHRLVFLDRIRSAQPLRHPTARAHRWQQNHLSVFDDPLARGVTSRVLYRVAEQQPRSGRHFLQRDRCPGNPCAHVVPRWPQTLPAQTVCVGASATRRLPSLVDEEDDPGVVEGRW